MYVCLLRPCLRVHAQAAAANKKDAAMFSKMFKPSKEKPAAAGTSADADAKENAPVANGHEKADPVEQAEAVLMEIDDGATAAEGAAGADEASEPVSSAAIK